MSEVLKSDNDNDLNPCLNCGCHEHEGLAEKWTRRAYRLMHSGEYGFRAAIDRIPPDIIARTSSDKVWGFGLDPFIIDVYSDCLVGRFRAAVRTPDSPQTSGPQAVYRFYCVTVPRTGEKSPPVPYEHDRGVPHSRPINGPDKYDWRIIEAMTDDEFAALLLMTLNTLIDFVIKQERE